MVKKLLAALVAAAVVAALLGFQLGRSSAEPEWYDGDAHVVMETRMVGVTADDWDFAFQGSVPWIDRKGSRHEDGWPRCLTKKTSEIRILAPPREFEELGTRPILAVDCRGSR